MFTDYWDWGLPEIAVVEDEQSSSLPPFTSVYRIVTKSPSSETIKPKAAKKKEAPIFQKPKSKPPAPALPLTPDIKLPFDWASTSTAVDNIWRSSLPRPSNLHEDCKDLIFSCDVKNICMEDLLDHVVYHQIKSKLQSSASWMGREDAKSGRHNCQQQSGATPVTPLLVRHIIVNSSDEDEYQVFGDKRELHVAFLTMIARECGITTMSTARMTPHQLGMYRQVANQLEAEMRKEYLEAYQNAQRLVDWTRK